MCEGYVVQVFDSGCVVFQIGIDGGVVELYFDFGDGVEEVGFGCEEVIDVVFGGVEVVSDVIDVGGCEIMCYEVLSCYVEDIDLIFFDQFGCEGVERGYVGCGCFDIVLCGCVCVYVVLFFLVLCCVYM